MENRPEPNLSIVYRWDPKEDGLSPDVLGESIIGFGVAIRELLKVVRLNDPVAVHVEVAKDGSIELGFVVQALHHVPIGAWRDLYDLLAFIGDPQLLEKAKAVAAVHDDINAFFAKNPVDMAAIGYVVVKLFNWAKGQKKVPTVVDEHGNRIPKNYAVRLHGLVKKGVYKKAMRPFVENQATEFEIRSIGEKKISTKINKTNFSEYLGAKDEILPQYENGKTYRFAAHLVGLEKSSGEHLKFKMSQFPRSHSLLVSYPEEGKATTDYTDYYGKDVFINAEVIRQSTYHKPKLRLEKIELAQQPLL